jgi:hypothetical protein
VVLLRGSIYSNCGVVFYSNVLAMLCSNALQQCAIMLLGDYVEVMGSAASRIPAAALGTKPCPHLQGRVFNPPPPHTHTHYAQLPAISA